MTSILLHTIRLQMNSRISRDDAACLLDQIKKKSLKDNKTHKVLYEKCCLSSPNDSGRKAHSSEVILDVIAGLTLKLDFLQSTLIEQMLAKCTLVLTHFMKDYGSVIEATVKEMLDIVNILKGGLRILLIDTHALTSEKDLYAQKALALAKGFVTASSHSLDMCSIQPRFGYLDVIGDISFKSAVDVHTVVDIMCGWQRQQYGGCGEGSRCDTSTSPALVTEKRNSMGDNLGFLESCYNRQLLRDLSKDAGRAVALVVSTRVLSDVDEAKEEGGREGGACIGTASDGPLVDAFTKREKCALVIHRFIFACWTSKWRRRQQHEAAVRRWLSAHVFRARLSARLCKKRKIAQSKIVICQIIEKYIKLRKLRAKSAAIIRSNIRKLFRNYLFRDMSAACRDGARRLVQREWALRHSDTALRLLRVETYLSQQATSSPPPLPFTKHAKPDKPLSQHEVYVSSAFCWDNIADFSKEELEGCNIHILNMLDIEEELERQDSSASANARALDTIERACAVSDVTVGAEKRMSEARVASATAAGDTSTAIDSLGSRGRRLSKGKAQRHSSAWREEGCAQAYHVSNSRHQSDRKLSKSAVASHVTTRAAGKVGIGEEGGRGMKSVGGASRSACAPPETERSAPNDFDGQSVQMQLDHIKSVLENSC